MDESGQYLWNEFRQVNYSYIIRNYMTSLRKHLGSLLICQNYAYDLTPLDL